MTSNQTLTARGHVHHEAPDYGALRHISTFQLRGGALVFHAFEIVDATQ